MNGKRTKDSLKHAALGRGSGDGETAVGLPYFKLDFGALRGRKTAAALSRYQAGRYTACKRERRRVGVPATAIRGGRQRRLECEDAASDVFGWAGLIGPGT